MRARREIERARAHRPWRRAVRAEEERRLRELHGEEDRRHDAEASAVSKGLGRHRFEKFRDERAQHVDDDRGDERVRAREARAREVKRRALFSLSSREGGGGPESARARAPVVCALSILRMQTGKIT